MVYYNFQGDELQNEFDEKMTHKYGDKYRCVKNVYPDVYKLPEEEIQPMTHIIRYQGDTMEEAEDLLRKHIKKNEPMWKENYFGEQKEKPHLEFNGETLSWVEDGQTKKTWTGMSGKPDYQCNNFQNMANKGPLPEGKYMVNQNQLQHYDDLTQWAKFKSKIYGSAWPGGQKSWGNHRVWLKPDEATNTYNRNNFSIHGGDELGSGGCIDLTNQMDDFNKTFSDYNQDLELYVKYPQGCWWKNK